MRDLLALFDQTQPSGQAMKTTITDVFNGIVKSIGSAITEGEVMALEFMVWGLSMELALTPAWSILQKIGGAIKTATTALATGGLGAPLAGLPTGGGPAAAPAAKSVDQLQGDALASTLSVLNALNPLAPLMGSKGLAIGNSIADGLVGGMGGSAARVTAAANDLGEMAVAGTKRGAGVKSPSKPAIEIGGFVAEGLGIGMTGSSAPARAGRQLSANALGGLVGGALTSPAANGNGGGGVTITGLQLTIMAPQGVTDATALSATGLAVALERLQLGSGR